MSGFDYFKKVLKQYADISGRASRSEYWYFVLFNACFAISLALLMVLVPSIGIAYILYALAMIVPGFCVTVRRLHDIGKSGWNLLFAFIPIVGPILLLIWYCTESAPGDNQWGPNPWSYSGEEENLREHLV